MRWSLLLVFAVVSRAYAFNPSGPKIFFGSMESGRSLTQVLATPTTLNKEKTAELLAKTRSTLLEKTVALAQWRFGVISDVRSLVLGVNGSAKTSKIAFRSNQLPSTIVSIAPRTTVLSDRMTTQTPNQLERFSLEIVDGDGKEIVTWESFPDSINIAKGDRSILLPLTFNPKMFAIRSYLQQRLVSPRLVEGRLELFGKGPDGKPLRTGIIEVPNSVIRRLFRVESVPVQMVYGGRAILHRCAARLAGEDDED